MRIGVQRELITAGDEIGSVEIDMAFADMVRERLLNFQKQLPRNMDEHEIQNLADRMARKHFRSHKEEFGEEDTMLRPEKSVDIPGFSETFSLPQARISRGKMVFTKYAPPKVSPPQSR